MARDFSNLDPSEVRTSKQLNQFGAYMTQRLPATTYAQPSVKVLANHIYFNGMATYDRGLLLSKDGTLTPKVILPYASGANPASVPIVIEHSDALIAWAGNSAFPYALNLRQGGVARNLNNAAALAGIIPVNPYTNAGYGFVALNNISFTPTTTGNDALSFEDSRYLIGVSAENTTSPPVTAPTGAPACTPANTGGTLVTATGTLDIAYAWVTRLSGRRMGHGITAPSPTQAAVVIPAGGTGTAGSVVVAVPAAPANVVGYVVYACQPTGGTLRVVGGGIATAAGQNHTIKATMTQLAMANRLFVSSATATLQGVMGTIENANPVTWGTARSFTSGYSGSLWSPFFKDPSIIFHLPSFATATQKADLYDIQAGTITLAQTTTPDGRPSIILAGAGAATLNANFCYRSIPELMAYAIGTPGQATAGVVGSGSGGFIQIRSCLTNEVLASFSVEDTNAYNQTPSGYYGFFDFEPSAEDTGATKSVDLLLASNAHRGIIRQPVVGWS